MTTEELEKELKKLLELAELHTELKTQIAELRARQEENPKPPHPRWEPKENEIYYFIFGEGTPYAWQWHGNIDDGTSFKRYSIGNVFHIEAEAEFAAERLKVLAEMREWAGSWDDVFVLTYVGNDDIVHVSNVLAFRNTFGEMRFATREDAENCIKVVGEDRIKKYYFMISGDEDDG